jgi:3-oxoacyl-[acyl-carrier-protein] synthase III
MGIWRESGLGFAGFGHHYPGPPLPVTHLPAVAANNIRPDALERIGIRTLHHSAPGQGSVDLGVKAARHALADAQLEPTRLDLVVVSNSSERMYVPELAPRLANELGARSALAFDVCGGCAGFVHAVQTAAALLQAHRWHNALVIAAEQFSHRTPHDSRDSLVAGDAAGAVVLSAGAPAGSRLLDSVLHAHGEHADVLHVPSDGVMRYDASRLVDLAIDSQLEVIEEICDRNHIELGDIDLIFPHPGTNRVVTTLCSKLGFAPAKVPNTFAHTGNTISAMIPSAMSECHAAGKLRHDSLVLACTAGAGWFSGGLLAVI